MLKIVWVDRFPVWSQFSGAICPADGNAGTVTTDNNTTLPRREYWDGRYQTAGPSAVSWFQERPATSLELIAETGLERSASVIDVGGGASRLVDSLLADGWSDVTVLDVSDVALAVSRERVGADRGAAWLEQDLLSWKPSRRYDLWHDRAVFHFLVEEHDRQLYRVLLNEALAQGGAVIVGAFASDGPTRCSGLPVVRYDVAALVTALGAHFDLLATRREEHVTPAGDVQPFTWVVLRTAAGR